MMIDLVGRIKGEPCPLEQRLKVPVLLSPTLVLDGERIVARTPRLRHDTEE